MRGQEPEEFFKAQEVSYFFAQFFFFTRSAFRYSFCTRFDYVPNNICWFRTPLDHYRSLFIWQLQTNCVVSWTPVGVEFRLPQCRGRALAWPLRLFSAFRHCSWSWLPPRCLCSVSKFFSPSSSLLELIRVFPLLEMGGSCSRSKPVNVRNGLVGSRRCLRILSRTDRHCTMHVTTYLVRTKSSLLLINSGNIQPPVFNSRSSSTIPFIYITMWTRVRDFGWN